MRAFSMRLVSDTLERARERMKVRKMCDVLRVKYTTLRKWHSGMSPVRVSRRRDFVRLCDAAGIDAREWKTAPVYGGEDGEVVSLVLKGLKRRGCDVKKELSVSDMTLDGWAKYGCAGHIAGRLHELCELHGVVWIPWGETAPGEAVKRAKRFLRRELSNGPIELRKLRVLAEKEGITMTSLRRAGGVSSWKEGFGRGARQFWELDR